LQSIVDGLAQAGVRDRHHGNRVRACGIELA
jgi:hypothetical protein